MLSVLMTHRGADPYRLENLRRTMRYWKKSVPNCEVIVVEQSGQMDVKTLVTEEGGKYFFVEYTGLFNRSWGMNIAFWQSNGEHIVCTDSDIILEQPDIREALIYLAEWEVINPYTKIFDLTQEESQQSPFPKHSKERTGLNMAGGILFIQRQAYVKIGGWNEEFEGWGGEDNAFAIKILRIFISHLTLPGTAYHLWHPTSKAQTIEGYNAYIRNLQRLDDLQNMAQDLLIAQCVAQRTFMGDPFRYAQKHSN